MKRFFLFNIFPFLVFGQGSVLPTLTPKVLCFNGYRSDLYDTPTNRKPLHYLKLYMSLMPIGKIKILPKKEADISPLNAGQTIGKIIYKKMGP